MNARPTTTAATSRARCTTRPATGRRAERLAKARLPHRALRLVDPENLAGGGYASLEALRTVREKLDSVAPAGPSDHTLVGIDRGNALGAGLTWPGARVVCGCGRDGADRALLEATDIDWVAEHYDSLVIASGDHAFADLAAKAKAAGLEVTVVAVPGCISADLYKASSGYHPFDRPPVEVKVVIGLTTASVVAA